MKILGDDGLNEKDYSCCQEKVIKGVSFIDTCKEYQVRIFLICSIYLKMKNLKINRILGDCIFRHTENIR